MSFTCQPMTVDLSARDSAQVGSASTVTGAWTERVPDAFIDARPNLDLLAQAGHPESSGSAARICGTPSINCPLGQPSFILRGG